MSDRITDERIAEFEASPLLWQTYGYLLFDALQTERGYAVKLEEEANKLKQQVVALEQENQDLLVKLDCYESDKDIFTKETRHPGHYKGLRSADPIKGSLAEFYSEPDDRRRERE